MGLMPVGGGDRGTWRYFTLRAPRLPAQEKSAR